jgi:hypothetical protein
MSKCIERARTTHDTMFRLDSVHGECVRNLTFACDEFETPTRTNPVSRNVATNPIAALDKLGGHVTDGSTSLGAAYYPPKRDQIKIVGKR